MIANAGQEARKVKKNANGPSLEGPRNSKADGEFGLTGRRCSRHH